MAIKDWLNSVTSAASKATSKSGAPAEERLTIDDLITLERYDEALTKLKKRVKSNKSNYRARIQLADVYLKTGKAAEGIEEYLSIADRYTSEGFFDKGYALVAKLARMLPHEEKLEAKMKSIRRSKRLEHRRQLVVTSLGAAGWAIEVRQHWSELIQGPIIEVLTHEQLTKLFPLLSILRLSEGEVLAQKDEAKEELYLILTGEIAAEVILASGSATDLRTFHGGDVVGDRALLKREPWPATYRAKTAARVLVLSREGFAQALVGEEDPRSFLNALRLQENDEQVAESAGKVKAASP